MFWGKFIREKNSAAHRWMKAYLRGVATYRAQGMKSQEVMEVIRKYVKVSEEAIQSSLPYYFSSTGIPDLKSIGRLQDWFYARGWVKKKVSPEEMVAMSFVKTH